MNRRKRNIRLHCHIPSDRLAFCKNTTIGPGLLRVKEHAGDVWLWAKPALLDWDSPITWLFSNPHGGKGWRGDLWGLDKRGRLLVVETKLEGSGPRYNPFTSLLKLVRQDIPRRNHCTKAKLNARWMELRAADDAWRNKQVTSTTRKRGLLPCRKYRDGRCPWQELFDRRLSELIFSAGYQRRVVKLLGKYGRRRQELPQVFAFIVLKRNLEAYDLEDVLSPKAIKDHKRLRKLPQMESRVHIRACWAKAEDGKTMSVHPVSIIEA
jgi:hypothetical protein